MSTEPRFNSEDFELRPGPAGVPVIVRRTKPNDFTFVVDEHEMRWSLFDNSGVIPFGATEIGRAAVGIVSLVLLNKAVTLPEFSPERARETAIGLALGISALAGKKSFLYAGLAMMVGHTVMKAW